MLGSFFIYFMEMDAIVQVGLSGTPEQNSENPTNQDEVLTVDFNFLNVKLNKKKEKKNQNQNRMRIADRFHYSIGKETLIAA